MCARSIEIEPNYAKFRGQQVIVALGNGAIWRRRALELFQELKARYPLLTDYDSFGIQANVLCGEPQQALNLLQQNTLPKPDAEQWLTQIIYALQVKQQLLELGEAVEKSLLEDTDLLEILEALFKAYPADPMIQVNLRKRPVPRGAIPAPGRVIIVREWRNRGQLGHLLCCQSRVCHAQNVCMGTIHGIVLVHHGQGTFKTWTLRQVEPVGCTGTRRPRKVNFCPNNPSVRRHGGRAASRLSFCFQNETLHPS
jgi:hypothetical protein